MYIVISCHNKILTEVGYRNLSSVTSDIILLEGKIYEIYFAMVPKEELISISFVDYNSSEINIVLTDHHRILSPENKKELKPTTMQRGDQILYYNKKSAKTEIKTISNVKPFIKQKIVHCGFPISTYPSYIINGVYIKNVGF